MARSSWRGSITFAGFPISVKAYNTTKSRSNDSFKTLCPCHGQPIKAPRVCATDGTEIPSSDLHKGVEVSKGNFVRLPDDALASIESAAKTVALDPSFAPAHTIPLHLSTGSYMIVPDDKVPGSDKPVAILREALANGGYALVAEWTPRAGSRDSIIVMRPHPDGIIANTLPYTTELVADVPKFVAPPVEEAERQMFEQVIAANYTPKDFDHTALVSRYKERRDAAVRAALNGQPIEAQEAAQTAVPDMMAALKASLAQTQEVTA